MAKSRKQARTELGWTASSCYHRPAMRNPGKSRWPIALLALVLACTGCGSGAATLTPVHGKVSVNGVPLHTGTIIFTPDPMRGTLGPLAHAEIQPDGTYTLATGDQPGAADGWYRVTIVALEPSFNPAQPDARLLPHSLLPDKYRDPELSGLVCEIRARQDNCIDFNLE
jgi:hypothetical protein